MLVEPPKQPGKLPGGILRVQKTEDACSAARLVSRRHIGECSCGALDLLVLFPLLNK